MKRKVLKSTFDGRDFIIREDKPEVGWYLLVYEDDYCKYDHLQDTLQDAKDFAYEEFFVPIDSWIAKE